MKANASKFKAICLSRENVSRDFEIDNLIIQSESVINLLGINIDNKLNFDCHVSVVCRKAATQINALQG